MSKKLIVTEKRSVASDIAKVLGGFKKHDGYFENENYIITWAIGHLLMLFGPEDYNARLKLWDMESLPIIPKTFFIKPKDATKKQLKIITELINRSDVGSLINAGDAGREGQLIQTYIYQYAKNKKPVERLWLSETTDKAIKKAFSSLRPDSDYDNLTRAAIARNQADWLVGINATRGFSIGHNDVFSVGRVQTPTLAILTAREEEIKSFVSEKHYELIVTFNAADQPFTAKWFREKSVKVIDRSILEAIQAKITGMPGEVLKIEEKDLNENAPLLCNLNDVQKIANKLWGYTASKTLSICQKLYEERKLLTYPRTDSRHLTVAMAATLPERLASLSSTELNKYLPATKGKVLDKRYVDDSKVTDHTAIIITDTVPNLPALTTEERNIYLLIAKRILAAYYPPVRSKQTKIITMINGEPFYSQGKVIVDLGWKAISAASDVEGKSKEKDDPILPDLVLGEIVKQISNEIKEKNTQPPKRYTEADLLDAMEHAGKFVDDEDLKEAMRGKGLGTPATRAGIIERLLAVGYITRQKKALIPTEKGAQLINIVPEKLKNPELTGEWEKKLLDIEKGCYNDQDFMDEIATLVRETIDKAKTDTPNLAVGICPKCGQMVKENSKAYGCSGYRDGCDFVIWKTMSDKNITPDTAKKLLENGATEKLEGFKSKKSGKLFSAALKLDDTYKVIYDFSNQ